MRRLLAVVSFVLVSSVVACSRPLSDEPADSLEARIARIENGLMPVVHIEGTDPVTFTLEDRIEEFGIPVNSDDGRIIGVSMYDEFLLSIVNEYDLPGVEQEVREVADMPIEQMTRFEGNYEMPEYETFRVRVVDDRLVMASRSFDPPLEVLPQSSTEFFSIDDGEIVTFDVDGDDVVGFEVWGLRAERVK